MSPETAAHSIPDLTIPEGHQRTLGNRGFSMVELIAVMGILTALALLAIPAYDSIKTKVREVKAMEEIRGLEKAITAFSIDRNALPTLGELGGVVGAAALIDPWGNPYGYGIPVRNMLTEPLNGDFDLYSAGADGLSDPDIMDPNCSDDILRSGDGGFVGLGRNLNLNP